MKAVESDLHMQLQAKDKEMKKEVKAIELDLHKQLEAKDK